MMALGQAFAGPAPILAAETVAPSVGDWAFTAARLALELAGAGFVLYLLSILALTVASRFAHRRHDEKPSSPAAREV